MISIEEFFRSFALTAKDYRSGADPLPEFNNKANEAQKTLFSLISPEYSKNERARALLEPFVVSDPFSSDSNGIVAYPSGFHRVLGMRYESGGETYRMHYASENELIEQSFIPQRKADLSRGIVYYSYINGELVVSPKTSISGTMIYLKHPEEVLLEYDFNVARDSYAQLSTNTEDFQWSEDAYNLLMSALLMEYSLIERDVFKSELAQYLLATDKINA